MTLTFGSLYSGIGGFDLALEWAGMIPKWQVEKDAFCLQVLAKHWPNVDRYTDVCKVRGTNGPIVSRRDADWWDWPEPVDVVCGGFPCQPFSSAGKQRGSEDDRNLWPEMLRIVNEFQPRWVIGENVAGIINVYLDKVLTDLEGAGYEVRAVVVPAAAVNAPHRRDRVFIVAHSISNDSQHERTIGQMASSQGEGQGGEEKRERVWNAIGSGGTVMGDSESSRRESGKPMATQRKEHSPDVDRASQTMVYPKQLPDWAGGELGQPSPITEFDGDGREVERNFRGVSYGVSRRVDRLRALGNAVVPQAVYPIAKYIMEIETKLAA